MLMIIIVSIVILNVKVTFSDEWVNNTNNLIK